MTTREARDTGDAVELLSSPPTNEDLDDLLEAAAPRRRSKLTTALVAALIFVFGFLAGSTSEKIAVSIQEAQTIEVEETAGTEAGAESTSALTGRVVMLDDDVVYVERSDGATVKVNVSEATIIGLSNAGEMGDLVPGDAVIVEGKTSTDGAVEASSIQQARPAP